MAQSRWLYFTLALVALACDQNTPSGPSLSPSRLRLSATPQVAATEEDGTLTVSGNDQVAYQTQFLPAYAYPLIADVSISGAVHFDGDTQFTPDHLASGDIGPAGILSGQTCMLRATVTFQNGSGLGAPGPCPTSPTGSQSISATELISGTPRFELQASTSTRNFCGPTTICITWSGSLQLTVVPERASLTLSIDNAAVDSGTPVTVTAAADPPERSGIAVPISNLDWQLPDPNESCAGNSLTCTFTATRSGDIQVSAIVNGSTSTDAVSLSVRPKVDTTRHDSTPPDSTGPCLAPRRGASAHLVPGLSVSGPALMRSGCRGGGGPKAKVRLEYPAGTPILQGGIPLILPAGIRQSDIQYDSILGRPPYLGDAIWPDSLMIAAYLDTVGPNPELLGRAITLSVEAVDSSGRSIDSIFGHAHPGAFGAKPAGSLEQTVVMSGTEGSNTTVFLPSGVSGPVILRGTAPNADSFIDTIWVGVPGLAQVQPSATHDTTGGVPAHPFGHNVWVRPEMLDTLARFADTVYSDLGVRSVFNDASLPFGGKFDLHQQWDAPDPGCSFTQVKNRIDTIVVASPGGCHQTHRTGWDVDLRIRGVFNPDDIDLVVKIWEAQSCSKAYFEGSHIHLALREGGRLYLRHLPGC